MSSKEKMPNLFRESRLRNDDNALADQRARTDAVDKNTERLRALRLAREAAAPPPQKKVVKQKVEKKKSASLTDYLNQQKDGGRNT